MKVVACDSFFESIARMCGWKAKLRNIWYKIECYLWYKYTTIKPKHLSLVSWCDRSELIKHVMFEILEKFIEKECSLGHIEWYGEYPHTIEVNREQKNVMDEMKDLLKWWNEVYIPYWNEDTTRPLYDALSEPTDLWIPIEENGKTYYEWKVQYNTPEEEQKAKEIYDQIRKLEEKIRKETLEMMHRLVNISPYMWT